MTNLFINESKQISAKFISAGTFIHKAGWIHERRTNNGFELIFPIKGTLNIRIANQTFHASYGDILVIPPNTVHEGSEISKSFIQFDWIHVQMTQINIVKDDLITKELLTTTGLLLPTFSKELIMSRVYVMVSQLLDIYQAKGSQQFLDNLVKNVLFEISMQFSELLEKRMYAGDTLQPIKEWIRIHAADNISLNDIAQFFGYNTSYLSRIYSDKMGITISREIKNYRIEKSKEFLLNDNMTIDEVSELVGYSDPKYYMRTFKSIEKVTPSQFRRAFDRRHMNLK